jgi:hypothetical protein
MKKVKLLFNKGQASIIEIVTDGKVERLSIPSTKLLQKDSEVFASDKDLEEAIPYGIPWEYKLNSFVIRAEDISDALHRYGVWTYNDYVDRPDAVKTAMLESCQESFRKIAEIAKEYKLL